MNTIARTLAFGILFFAMPDGAVQSEELSVQNCGRPGANTRESLARLPGVLASKPDHLVILLGMNDALNSAKLVGVKEYKKNLTAMIAAAETTKIRSILLVTLHPVITDYLSERHPKHPQVKRLQEHLNEYDAAIRQVAKETGATLVDWRARFLAESPGDSVEDAVANQKEVLIRCVANSGARDGNHLTANGYRLLADEVAVAMRNRVKAGETVACFGDSITYGSHMTGWGTATGKTYPAFLAAELGVGKTK